MGLFSTDKHGSNQNGYYTSDLEADVLSFLGGAAKLPALPALAAPDPATSVGTGGVPGVGPLYNDGQAIGLAPYVDLGIGQAVNDLFA